MIKRLTGSSVIAIQFAIAVIAVIAGCDQPAKESVLYERYHRATVISREPDLRIAPGHVSFGYAIVELPSGERFRTKSLEQCVGDRVWIEVSATPVTDPKLLWILRETH